MSSCHCSNCSCGHEHTHTAPDNIRIFILRLAVAALVVLGHLFDLLPEHIELPLLVIAYLLAGYNVLKSALHNILHGQLFDENFLMTLASFGAFALGDMEEAVSVMIFYGIGEILQALAVNRSREDIAKLMDVRPQFANLKRGHELKVVNPAQVQVNDIILIRPGERIPLDGVVIEGQSFINTRALTGESKPQKALKGDTVLSGTVNISGLLEVCVQKNFADSTISKILELIEHAQEKKAPSEQFITKFARYYTPFVVFAALSVALLPPLFGFGSFSDWLYRALTFLIVACPCALVISIPIGFFGGIGSAARQGILVKGGNYLEALNKVDTIVFDKTGTLTYGVFEVVKVQPASSSIDAEQLLYAAALAEQHSLHPIARAICSAYGQSTDINVQVEETSGMGVSAQYKGDTILVGNAEFMRENNIADIVEIDEQTVVYIALNSHYLGYIIIADQVRDNVRSALKELKALGVRCMVMLTGDSQKFAQEFVKNLDLDGYSAGLLPQDKVQEIEKVMVERDKKGKVVFVGDGINDAPVITRADVGVAVGGVGSDAAIEAADIVIMNDDIGKLAAAIKIAKKTRAIVMQNIVFSLSVKVGVMVLAFFGMTSMWFAIFADVGVALLAVLNSLRAMRI